MKKLKVFDVVDYLLMLMLGAITLIPFLTVVAKAVSSPPAVLAGYVKLLPKELQFDTILYVLKRVEVKRAFSISIFVTLAGTLLAMILTVTSAYPLSKPHLKGRRIFLYIYVFVMLFHAGMIPNYLLFRSLKLLNTVWALIIPSAFAVSNMFIVKNYFESLPESVEESAKIDGASNILTLIKVVLPMSKPVLATVTLYYAVGYWNNYFSGIMYISNTKLRTLQHYLYELIQMSQRAEAGQMDITEAEEFATMSSECLTCANIVITTIPILLAYPFLQKHFVKGITIGSVKG